VPRPRDVPLLSARLNLSDAQVWIAEVHVKGLLAREVTMRVNGKAIPIVPSFDDDPK
jgi:hypothetical protein